MEETRDVLWELLFCVWLLCVKYDSLYDRWTYCYRFQYHAVSCPSIKRYIESNYDQRLAHCVERANVEQQEVRAKLLSRIIRQFSELR